MRILFMGTPDFAVATLRALAKSEHEVVGVITQPDKPKGRGKTLLPTPVKEEALKYGLSVLQPSRVRNTEVIEQIRKLNPDIIVVVAFGQLIPKEILDMPAFGCVNVHASLLPKYRGAAPIQWAVINGDAVSGVTIMKMDAGLDTGDMISVREVPIEKEETGGSLFDKLSEVGAQLLIDTLPSIESGAAVYTPQPKESPTAYASMLDKKMGRIDWEQDACRIECLIRGLSPWPSAYTYLNGKTLKIWKAEVTEAVPAEPGTIVQADKAGLVVTCGSGSLRITRLQLEGKKQMDADSFLRGYRIETGTKLTMNKE